MKKKIKRLKIGGTGVCSREHVGEMPDEALAAIEDLPFSQAGPGRHRCAACAYLLGVQHGEEKAIRKVLAPDHGFNSERSQRAENGGRT